MEIKITKCNTSIARMSISKRFDRTKNIRENQSSSEALANFLK